MTSVTIPIVDLSRLISREEKVDETDWDRIAKEIECALSQVGFVYLTNHGIPSEIIDKAFEASKTFFELPMEVKRKYQKNATQTFHGFAEPGQELLNKDSKFELRFSFDMPVIKSDIYPDEEVPEFRTSLKELQQRCHPLIKLLQKILAKSLELPDENYFCKESKWMDDDNVKSLSAFRTLYYPPVEQDDKIEPGTVRCAEHTDYGTLTLLFQDAIGGLEVKTTAQTWIPATPIPGSILVNTGDLLEFWSGGHFPATAHRVLIPEIELKKRIARQSIVYFVHPDDSAVVSPLKEKSSVDYKEITAREHAMRKLNASYQY